MSFTQNSLSKLIPVLPQLDHTHESRTVLSSGIAVATGVNQCCKRQQHIIGHFIKTLGDSDGEILDESGTNDDDNGASLLNPSVIGSGCIVLERDDAASPKECAAFPRTMPEVEN